MSGPKPRRGHRLKQPGNPTREFNDLRRYAHRRLNNHMRRAYYDDHELGPDTVVIHRARSAAWGPYDWWPSPLPHWGSPVYVIYRDADGTVKERSA